MDGLHRSTIEKAWTLWMVPTTLVVGLAVGMPLAVDIALSRADAETEAFDSVYYTALLSGRDPDAALRKAHFTTSILTKQFGMPRFKAAAEVAKFMISRSGRLCGGG
jgi:hypothetical protein